MWKSAEVQIVEFEYAADGDLKQARRKRNATSGDGVLGYAYDGQGKRVRKVVGSVETLFVYDAFGQLAAEYENTTAATNGTRFVTADHLGSPRVVTDSVGGVVSRHDYMAFGEEIQAGTAGRTGSDGDKYSTFDDLRKQYTGYERDVESGLDYAQARYYNSRHGRFTSPDPLTSSASIRDPQSFNRYTYAMNSPYKFTDPLGLLSQYTTGANGRNWDSYGLGGGGAFSSALDGFHRNKDPYEGDVIEDPLAGGEGADPQGGKPNIKDMVSPNNGVGKMADGSYRFKVNADGAIGHDGEHVLGGPNGSTVSAIAGLTGRVLTWYSQGEKNLFTVYIQIDKQVVMVLKDLQKLSSKIKQAPNTNPGNLKFLSRSDKKPVTLKAGDAIGQTAPWSDSANKSSVGLHFGFVKFQHIEQYRQNISKNRGSPQSYFVSAPCGSSSPVRC